MADKKISELTALSGADTASNDVLAIVDTSAVETKKITIDELQKAPVSSGTANGVAYLNGSKALTTGSALTFDGTNFAISGGLLSGDARLGQGGTKDIAVIVGNTAGSGPQIRALTFNEGMYAPLTSLGEFFVWSPSGSEQMRLTSTGLGIGTSSPASRLDVGGTTALNWVTFGTSSALATIGTQGTSGASLFVNTASVNSNYASGLAIDGSYASTVSTINIKALGVRDVGYKSQLTFSTTDSSTLVERMRIDASGNFIHQVNGTAPTLSTNSTMSFELTSNTSLKVVVRGTDGVTRSVSLTLA